MGIVDPKTKALRVHTLCAIIEQALVKSGIVISPSDTVEITRTPEFINVRITPVNNLAEQKILSFTVDYNGTCSELKTDVMGKSFALTEVPKLAKIVTDLKARGFSVGDFRKFFPSVYPTDLPVEAEDTKHFKHEVQSSVDLLGEVPKKPRKRTAKRPVSA